MTRAWSASSAASPESGMPSRRVNEVDGSCGDIRFNEVGAWGVLLLPECGELSNLLRRFRTDEHLRVRAPLADVCERERER